MSKSTQMLTLRAIAFLAVLTLQFLSPRSLLAGVHPDPVCEQQCHDDYIFCLDYYCDPRGTCSCWTDYQNCVSYCPQVCTEPKSVRTYSLAVAVNRQMYLDQVCLKFGPSKVIHNKFTYRNRIDTYRETTHCDGSKTTELLSSVTGSQTYTCWLNVSPTIYCSNAADPLYYPRCPFN
jgi:hypothetical protein